MAITGITTEPQYPPPGRVRLVFGRGGTGNFVRVWVTDAPPGSKWRNKLDEAFLNAKATRVLMVECGTEEEPEVELDKGGAYVLAAQEYTVGPATGTTYGGGYKGDPESYQTETKDGAESSVTVYVGQRLVSQLGSPEYGTAKLVLWVWNTVIRPTTVTTHGEKTPAIIGATGKALTAAENATVLSHVDALESKTASQLYTNLAALHAELRTDVAAHFNAAASHYAVDTANDTEIERLPAAPTTPEGYYYAAQVFRKRLRMHMTNDDGTGPGLNLVHSTAAGASATPDYVNLPIGASPSGAASMAYVMALYGDLRRAYEAHRQDTTAHLAADSTNTISTALDPLLDLHMEFLNAQRSLSPTAPATQNPAATELIHAAGFVEVPPGI